ncbi:hypothetical protein [Cognatitamlana onchidii]|uniref:hypothetical protein n=1 Tax=Cognatitamlana onchidii TaxID=2562860 RepID=UPI0010A5E873|nr:hypothetical protein [Algibacter onchidii]
MKENKYIEKFKHKSKRDLEYKVNNPSLFDSESILAAKHILENYSEFQKQQSETKNNCQEIENKSFSTNSFLIPFIIFSCLIAVVILINGLNNIYLLMSITSGYFSYLLFKHYKSWKSEYLNSNNTHLTVKYLTLPIILMLVCVIFFFKSFSE